MLIKKIIFALVVTSAATSFASGIADSALTAEVKAHLLQEPDIPKSIDVRTENGVVHLKGVVDTHLQAHKAIEVASSVDKVIDVIDTDLNVRESKSFLTDAIITAKVKGKIRHLYLHHRISPDYQLHVETTGQVVHIFGNVASLQDIDIIVSAARDTKGVKSVQTNITRLKAS